MESPRKSARKRVNISYANLLGDESDEEFFVGKPQVKSTKKKKTANSDEEYAAYPPPTSPPKKQKVKMPTNSNYEMRKAKEVVELASKPTEVPPIPLSKQPIISPSEVEASPVVKQIRSTLPQAGIQTKSLVAHAKTLSRPPVPSTPPIKNSSLFCLLPSSGLRLGLSRRNIKKSLHSNVRLSN